MDQQDRLQKKSPQVLVGLSGGVDSTVAAATLLAAGYRVEGFHILNGFPGRGEAGAERAAARLGIPLHKADCSAAFRTEVVEYLIGSYLAGRTPNPCAVCNRRIKFRSLLKKADELGFDFIATGHYARIEPADGSLRLLKGVDAVKDQSYFLFLLEPDALPRILFPNGWRTKVEIRREAEAKGLIHAQAEESQELCFIPGNDYRRFIEEQASPPLPPPGNIVDRQGRIVGRHEGLHAYTIGQRKRLGIASERPYYILTLDQERNEIVVGREEEQGAAGLIAVDLHWLEEPPGDSPVIEAVTKIRYRHAGAESRVILLEPDTEADGPAAGRRCRVEFTTPQRAVTPGQAVVFYRGERLLGGGWIERGTGDV
jgi:tRNA-uridine 2-sulfurtransferase